MLLCIQFIFHFNSKLCAYTLHASSSHRVIYTFIYYMLSNKNIHYALFINFFLLYVYLFSQMQVDLSCIIIIAHNIKLQF